jgi:hypothetical protein
MSRSKCGKAQGRDVVSPCGALGYHVYGVRGDVTQYADVDTTNSCSAPLPEGGVVQGVMLFRVSSVILLRCHRPFSSSSSHQLSSPSLALSSP